MAGNARPPEAAKQLGVSESTLRRLSGFYEAVFGPLPRDSRGRTYPDDAAKRMIAARQLHDQGKASSLQHALEVLATAEATGADPEAAALAPGHGEGREVASELLRELTRLREAVEAQGRELEALRAELRQALPSPKDTRPWWRRLFKRKS